MKNEEKKEIASLIIKNITFLTTFKILIKLIGFIVAIYLARVLSKEGFGLYNYAIAFLPIFQAFNGGVRVAGTQLVSLSMHEGKGSALLGIFFNVLSFNIFSSLIAYALVAIFIVSTSTSVFQQNFVLLILTLLFIHACDPKWFLQGLEKMKLIGIADFIKQALFLVLVLIFIGKKDDLSSLPYINILAEGTIICVLFFYVIKLFFKNAGPLNITKLLPDKVFLSGFFRHAFPIGISFFIIIFITNIGVILLAFFKDHEKVALFSAAYKITASLNEFRVLIVFVLFPVFVKLWHSNREYIKDIFRMSFVFNCLIYIPAALILIYFSQETIIFIYSVKYSESGILLSLLLLDSIILWLNMLFPAFINATRNEGPYLKGNLLILILSILLLLILVPLYEAKGVIYTRIIGDIFSLVFFSVFIHTRLSINMKEILFIPLISLIPLLATVLVMILWVSKSFHSIYFLFLVLLAYYVSLIIFKIIKKQDLYLISNVFMRKI